MRENQPKRRIGRRSLLRGVGAGALATSAVVFGTSQPAAAGNYGCCYLVFPPGSYTGCRRQRNYIWTCRINSSRGCSCCEVIGSNGSYIASAYHCEST